MYGKSHNTTPNKRRCPLRYVWKFTLNINRKLLITYDKEIIPCALVTYIAQHSTTLYFRTIYCTTLHGTRWYLAYYATMYQLMNNVCVSSNYNIVMLFSCRILYSQGSWVLYYSDLAKMSLINAIKLNKFPLG